VIGGAVAALIALHPGVSAPPPQPPGPIVALAAALPVALMASSYVVPELKFLAPAFAGTGHLLAGRPRRALLVGAGAYPVAMMGAFGGTAFWNVAKVPALLAESDLLVWHRYTDSPGFYSGMGVLVALGVYGIWASLDAGAHAAPRGVPLPGARTPIPSPPRGEGGR